MAKEENTKKTKAKVQDDSKDIQKENDNTIIRETITYDNSPIFNKMLVCLYIIIALLALNIIVTAIKGTGSDTSSTDKKTTTTTTETANYDVSSFKKITADEFVDAFNGDKAQLIYLGRANCGYCVRYVPILTEVQKKYDFQTLYLDVNTANAQVNPDGMKKIIALDEEFFTGEDTAYGYTPATLIVKNGEIVDYKIGLLDASTLEALVSKYFDKK